MPSWTEKLNLEVTRPLRLLISFDLVRVIATKEQRQRQQSLINAFVWTPLNKNGDNNTNIRPKCLFIRVVLRPCKSGKAATTFWRRLSELWQFIFCLVAAIICTIRQVCPAIEVPIYMYKNCIFFHLKPNSWIVILDVQILFPSCHLASFSHWGE